ncbi:MAG: exodeoxyribonuclease VII small subunit [Verrucomicrobia bacterium]|nr:MAG: exodeoxyribonuclease VII small subunit [Verrucomicrobiota bacterium]
MTSKPKQPSAALNFETAMNRLEAIVEQMESGKLPLEDLIVRYEEGMNLVKICQERLASAEQKIEIIARDSAGKPIVKDFEPAAETKIDDEAADERGEQIHASARRDPFACGYQSAARTRPAATCTGGTR